MSITMSGGQVPRSRRETAPAMSTETTPLAMQARDVSKHPLPAELQQMAEDETICKFCGISYLIHRQVKALQEEKEFLEGQLRRFKDDAAQANAMRERIRQLEADEEVARVELGRAEEKLQTQQRALADVRDRMPVLFQSLRKQLTALRETAVPQMQAVASAAGSDIAQHVQAVAARCARLERDKQQLEDMNKQASERVASLSSLQASYTRSREEVERLKADLAQTEAAHKDAQAVRAELEQKTAALAAAQARIRALEDESVRAHTGNKEEMGSLQAKLTAAQAELAAVKRECKECTAKLHEAERSKQVETAQQSRLASACAWASQSLEKAEAAITKLQHDKDKLTQELARVRASVVDKASSHELIAQSKAEVEQRLSDTVSELNNMRSAKEALSKENEALKHKLQELNSICETMEHKVTQQQQDTHAQLTTVIAQLKQQLQGDKERFEKELQLASHRSANLSKQAEVAREENAKLMATITELEQQLQHTSVTSSEQVLKLQQQLAEKKRANEELDQRLQLALQNAHDPTEARQLREALSGKEEEIAVLQDTVARECMEREQLVKSLESAREQVMRLQGAGSRRSTAPRYSRLLGCSEAKRRSTSAPLRLSPIVVVIVVTPPRSAAALRSEARNPAPPSTNDMRGFQKDTKRSKDNI
ncbi:hypothetical protein PTSG_02753 [Salpingoeca rosetta]|uniref:Uncharacterized protein n=1 Tax=Salpingoeca rosetta (strain ATCC 50818 / BSB-021) TaxID=946362 RepID=F2U378_SALR5|nr:uncharacterized protein PTSG_02753 [Salpingoeca rosetta]EGD82072.1 hypothetical protein PTSG_02753 [Salpingoeca rosetta]|eukprot:XP_004996255.1 hypothetical protein PTSG_02753 [Salpingoeca rosetta]